MTGWGSHKPDVARTMTEECQTNADNCKKELTYELTRSQNHTNDMLTKVLNKLDDMSTEQRAMKNDIHNLGTQQREMDAKMAGQFAETNTRISQLDKQIQELKDKEEA